MHPSQPQDSMPASDPAAARAPPRLSQVGPAMLLRADCSFHQERQLEQAH